LKTYNPPGSTKALIDRKNQTLEMPAAASNSGSRALFPGSRQGSTTVNCKEFSMFFVPMTRSSAELARSFDRMFDDSFFERFLTPSSTDTASRAGIRSPTLDVTETEHGYTIKIDLPGMGKEDVKISIDGRRVMLEAANARQEEKKDGERVVYSERSATNYARSFTLPMEVDQTESSAKMDQGVLTLALAKRSSAQPRQLSIS
jgi:HSP20 family protein